MTRQRIAVAMSGGIDSAAAAAILVQSGFEVVGVTLRLWSPIPEKEAAEVARKLQIPHEVLDLQADFRRLVIKYFVEEYKRGRTPNPCVVCNPVVKFGLLLDYVTRELGAQKLATGHYARIGFDSQTGKWKLLRGIDPAKDQSYMLYRLTQAQLEKIEFPIGYYTKKQALSLVETLGLPVRRTESQDICFVTEGDYRDFLASEAQEFLRPGPMLDIYGKQIGKHQGIAFYTVGQRRGLKIATGRRMYVVRIDSDRNAIILGDFEQTKRRRITLESVNLISGERIDKPIAVSTKIRYNAEDSPSVLIPKETGKAEIIFDKPV
ncbi:MAG: tRNA 2-thiouridine(34) synthase MnmA, partial [Armatimonadota bacterium]